MSSKPPFLDGPRDLQADQAVFGGPTDFPEKKLMIAMIEQAKIDLFGSDKQRVQKALVWFLQTRVKDHTGRPWLLSFESLCEQLELDADVVRRGILHRGSQ